MPAGADSVLDDVTVQGGLTVEPGARVIVRDAEIRGSIVATQPAYVLVDDATVRGSLPATDAPSLGSSGFNEVTIFSTEIRGDVVLTDNHSSLVQLSLAVVRGSVTFSGNTETVNNINANTIDVNLDCIGNTLAPTGDPNTVGGTAPGQCAGLVAP